MKTSILIREIRAFFKQNGDMEVGIHNPEFACCEDIGNIAVRNRANVPVGSLSADDESLGEKFIELQA